MRSATCSLPLLLQKLIISYYVKDFDAHHVLTYIDSGSSNSNWIEFLRIFSKGQAKSL